MVEHYRSGILVRLSYYRYGTSPPCEKKKLENFFKQHQRPEFQNQEMTKMIKIKGISTIGEIWTSDESTLSQK